MNRHTAPTPRYRLDHVGFVYSDPEAAAERLGRILDLPLREVGLERSRGYPALQVGQTWLEFRPAEQAAADQPVREGLHELGFVELPGAGAAEATTGAVEARVQDGLTVGGVRVAFFPHTDQPDPAPAGAAGVERLDHIGVASTENAAYRTFFVDQLGLTLESSQIDSEGRIAVESFASDKYGVVYHTREPEWLGGLHVQFITVGDCDLECLQDLAPRGPDGRGSDFAGSTKRDQSAIARFVETRGPGLHHLAVKVTDVRQALAHAEQTGAVLLDRQGRPGSRQAQIAFLHPKSTAGVLVHFVQRQPPD